MKQKTTLALEVSEYQLQDINNFCVNYNTELFFYKNNPYIMLMQVTEE